MGAALLASRKARQQRQARTESHRRTHCGPDLGRAYFTPPPTPHRRGLSDHPRRRHGARIKRDLRFFWRETRTALLGIYCFLALLGVVCVVVGFVVLPFIQGVSADEPMDPREHARHDDPEPSREVNAAAWEAWSARQTRRNINRVLTVLGVVAIFAMAAIVPRAFRLMMKLRNS